MTNPQLLRTFERGQEPQMEDYKKRKQNMGYIVWIEEKNNRYVVHSELTRDPYQYRPKTRDYDKMKKREKQFGKVTGKNPRL